MRLLVFSDIHGDAAALRRLMEIEADYYIAAGDLANWGRGLDPLGPILQMRTGCMWVLPGNHEDIAAIDAFCEKFGFNSMHGKHFEAGGWHVAGLGYSNPTPFDTPGEYTEDEMARHLEPFAGLDPMILVCHCPPKGTPLDEASPGRHFGSTAVKAFVDRHQPAWFLCGHIHEAAGREVQLGRTRAVNVGKRGWLVEV